MEGTWETQKHLHITRFGSKQLMQGYANDQLFSLVLHGFLKVLESLNDRMLGSLSSYRWFPLKTNRGSPKNQNLTSDFRTLVTFWEGQFLMVVCCFPFF